MARKSTMRRDGSACTIELRACVAMKYLLPGAEGKNSSSGEFLAVSGHALYLPSPSSLNLT